MDLYAKINFKIIQVVFPQHCVDIVWHFNTSSLLNDFQMSLWRLFIHFVNLFFIILTHFGDNCLRQKTPY